MIIKTEQITSKLNFQRGVWGKLRQDLYILHKLPYEIGFFLFSSFFFSIICSYITWQVDELMGDMDSAAVFYSKAVRLLEFLRVEAPSLILNPPFSLTSSDRYRLRTYIGILNNRQGYSTSQRMALLKCEEQQCPP